MRGRYRSVRELFVNVNATDPQSAIEIEDVSSEQQATIRRLIGESVVKKVDHKHYFDLGGEEEYLRRVKRHNLWVIFVLLFLTIGLTLALKLSR